MAYYITGVICFALGWFISALMGAEKHRFELAQHYQKGWDAGKACVSRKLIEASRRERTDHTVTRFPQGKPS